MPNLENLQKIEEIIYNNGDGGELNEVQENTLRKKIDEYWTDHVDVTTRFPQWKKQIAWVAGYQLYDYHRRSSLLLEMPMRKKNQLIFNRLRPFVRAMLAKLTADIPQMSVVPNTSENEDAEAARAGNKLIEHLTEKVDLPGVLSNAKLWSIVANRAFFRVFWDEDSHGTVKYEEGEETIQEGDVNMECISPFHCRVDPLYFEWEKWRWFVFGEEVDAGALEKEYDIEEGTLEEKSQVLDDAFNLESFDSAGGLSMSPDIKQHVTGRTVVQKELWTPKIYVFTAGDKILKYGVNPYGEIPFYPIEERLIPISNYEKGFQYNESLVKDAITIQREYNKMYSLKSNALDKASN